MLPWLLKEKKCQKIFLFNTFHSQKNERNNASWWTNISFINYMSCWFDYLLQLYKDISTTILKKTLSRFSHLYITHLSKIYDSIVWLTLLFNICILTDYLFVCLFFVIVWWFLAKNSCNFRQQRINERKSNNDVLKVT